MFNRKPKTIEQLPIKEFQAKFEDAKISPFFPYCRYTGENNLYNLADITESVMLLFSDEKGKIDSAIPASGELVSYIKLNAAYQEDDLVVGGFFNDGNEWIYVPLRACSILNSHSFKNKEHGSYLNRQFSTYAEIPTGFEYIFIHPKKGHRAKLRQAVATLTNFKHLVTSKSEENVKTITVDSHAYKWLPTYINWASRFDWPNSPDIHKSFQDIKLGANGSFTESFMMNGKAHVDITFDGVEYTVKLNDLSTNSSIWVNALKDVIKNITNVPVEYFTYDTPNKLFGIKIEGLVKQAVDGIFEVFFKVCIPHHTAEVDPAPGMKNLLGPWLVFCQDFGIQIQQSDIKITDLNGINYADNYSFKKSNTSDNLEWYLKCKVTNREFLVLTGAPGEYIRNCSKEDLYSTLVLANMMAMGLYQDIQKLIYRNNRFNKMEAPPSPFMGERPLALEGHHLRGKNV